MSRFVLFCSLLLLCFSACNTKQVSQVVIDYPHPLPDTVALAFMPGVVSKDSLDFNSIFSPDGKSFYFCRSNKGQWDIYVMTNKDGKWTEPVIATFSEPLYSEADPFFAPDGRLFYISNRPKNGSAVVADFDIWYICPLPGNKWSAPVNMTEVNSDNTEYYVSFAANGNMYLGSSRAGGYGSEDIYVSRYINGKYTKPENLGPSINTAGSEHDPCISPDEDFLVYTAEYRKDGLGEADLYCSKRDSKKEWRPAVNMGKSVNTTTYEYCPYLTPDSKYFFFSSEYDVKWIDAGFVKRKIDTFF